MAPRFLKLAEIRKPLPARKDTLRVWNAIRQLRRFTLGDLEAVCEMPAARLRNILAPWRRAAIVRNDNDGFRLARDLGAQPPFRYGHVSGLVDRKTGEVLPFAETPVKRNRAKRVRA